MAHKAEINFKLTVTKKSIADINIKNIHKYDVIFLHLPNISIKKYSSPMDNHTFKKSEFFQICNIVHQIGSNLKDDAKILIMGNPLILPYVHEYLKNILRYQTWLVVRLSKDSISGDYLKNEHDGILVYTNNDVAMQHSVIRIGYEYCQTCKKTVKDYGGKKHLYHEYGTALSDVWKDFTTSRLDEFPDSVITRIRDLFSIKPNKNMIAISLWNYKLYQTTNHIPDSLFPMLSKSTCQNRTGKISGHVLNNGDCIEELQKIKENTIDTIFVDPPYNLSKNYDSFKDAMSMEKYFEWCDQWLSELCRILRPGGSLFVLNIPISALRHFLLLRQILHFQNWIVWDALSTPLKKIMPAHYSILYFTKNSSPDRFNMLDNEENNALTPIDYKFCYRPQCIKKRIMIGAKHHKLLTDLWSDVHRIKHNSLREDHPTLLPPKLLRRLVLMSTNKNDIVLDCFNGVGTTTLIAKQLCRKYVGIEKSSKYYRTSKKRHADLQNGLDPFAKRKTIPFAKNSLLPRVKSRKYAIPKRTLQLDVKEIQKKIKRMPQRKDVIKHSKYPIKYFDDYFRNWFEVTEAARTTGMTEFKQD